MRRTAEIQNTTPQPLSNDSTGRRSSADASNINTPTMPRNGDTSTGHENQVPHLQNGPLSSGTSSLPKADQLKYSTSSTKDQVSNTAGSSRDNAAVPIINTRSRRDRPCDACRRRKSRCVLNEGTSVCVLCRFHNQECTFVQSPQPRRRRAPVGSAGADNKKDRERDNRERDGGGQKDRERGSSYSKKRFEIFSFAFDSISILCSCQKRWGIGLMGAGRSTLVVVVRRISADNNG